MTIAHITDTILAKAKQEAEVILRQARQDAEAITKRESDATAELLEQMEKAAVQKKAQIERKVDNLAMHERKAKLLATKQQVLDEVFATALQQICDQHAEKKKIIAAMLKSINAKTGAVNPVKNDEAVVTDAVKAAGKEFTVGKSIEGEGGFVFVSKDVEMDFRFETILYQQLKKSLEYDLKNILFPQHA